MSEDSYESRFSPVICEAFAKLCGDYRLSVVSQERLRLVFANEHVVLIVAQKHIWDSVCVAIGRKGSGELYDLDVIAEWSGAEPVPLQIGDASTLRKLLGRVVDLLRERADDLLLGREEAFASLDLLSKAKNAAYNKTMSIDPIITRAREAWQSRDYGSVVELLSSVRFYLSDVDTLRLRMAAKYLENESA